MYNKIIKKYYFLKIITLHLPKKPKTNKASFYLCKYFIKETPYTNLDTFIKEFYKISSVLRNDFLKRNLLFLGMHKAFVKNFQNKKVYSFNTLTKSENIKSLNYQNISLVVLLNNYNYKNIAFFKDKKVPSLGFINFHCQPNMTDYTLLLESQHFSSLFLLNYLLKRPLR